ncbi:MAG: hypothetical protein DWP97_00515 [Calditrichaeota bacterium]|nr:MAG: hypothetical protein DWP97_00515 [Calditrichota bacterium]
MVRNKRRKIILSCIFVTIFASVGAAEQTEEFKKLYEYYKTNYNFYAIPDTVYTIEGELKLPEGYTYKNSKEIDSYTDWVSNFPLWHKYKHIGMWKGTKQYDATEISRAIHLPWSGRSFAEYSIPLRMLGEYLFQIGQKDKFVVEPKGGETLSYKKWLEAKPVFDFRGNVIWKDDLPKSESDDEYYKYMLFTLQNSSYGGLMKNCNQVESSQVQAGDMFIASDDTGNKGAVYVILRLISNQNDSTLFLVGTGCEEACDFHIPLLTAKRDEPWVSQVTLEAINSEFKKSGFYRFKIFDKEQ